MTSASTDITTAPAVLCRVERGLGLITLNRPGQLNAIDHAMVRTMLDVLRGWIDDPDVDTVVIDGAGERGLSAGGDIRAVHRATQCGGAGMSEFWHDEYRLNVLIDEYPKPILALMTGIVMGGGVGVSSHGSHRVVTESSIVGMPEAGIGLIPDVGGTYLLAKAPGRLGEHLGLTAGRMSGADAIAAGFADRFVPAADLARLIDLTAVLGPDEALSTVAAAMPPSVLIGQRTWIDECYDADSVPEIVHRLRDRPEAEAREAADAIGRVSPTSAVVTLQAIRAIRREGASLRQAVNLEFDLVNTAVHQPDLAEGIRAQIIDKDRHPRWSPTEPEQVRDLAEWFAAAPGRPFPDEPELASAPVVG